LNVTAIAPNMRQWPSPQDPGYRSEAYQVLKQQEAERMLDQIEQHYPGFRQHVRTLMVGTPTTIERYLLKNGGAMGGPKKAIGQEMLSEANAPRAVALLRTATNSACRGVPTRRSHPVPRQGRARSAE